MESLEEYRRRLTQEQRMDFDLQRSAFIQGHRYSKERLLKQKMLEWINSNSNIISKFSQEND